MFFRKSNFAITELFDFALQHRETVEFTVVMGHCGHYTILGNIGEGAHGIVFKAKHIEVR